MHQLYAEGNAPTALRTDTTHQHSMTCLATPPSYMQMRAKPQPPRAQLQHILPQQGYMLKPKALSCSPHTSLTSPFSGPASQFCACMLD